MTCPKCGLVQPGERADCPRCGLVFAKWRAGAPASAAAASPPRALAPGAPSGGSGSSGVLPAVAAAVVLGALALIAAVPPSGGALPAGAEVRKDDGFALAPGPEWIALTRDNLRSLAEKSSGRLPDSLVDAFRNLGAEAQPAVSFIRMGGEGFPPVVNVVAMKGRPGPLDARAVDEASATLQRRYRTFLPDFTMKPPERVTVDRLASARLEGAGTLRTKLSGAVARGGTWDPTLRTYRYDVQAAQVREDRIRFVQYLVPGGEHGYVVTFTLPGAAEGERDGEETRILGTFRVLDRPPRFGYVARGAAIGGFVGGLMGIVATLVRGRLRRAAPFAAASVLALGAVFAGSGCRKAMETGPPKPPFAPEHFSRFLPPAPAGWSEGETKLQDADERKMRPPAAMASREFQRGRDRLYVTIVDGGGDPRVNAMYLADQRDGRRVLRAPVPERKGWPTVERETEDGERELVAVVGGRYIVRIASRSASADELRALFDSMDAKGLAATTD
jgi:hypothetical protein